MSTPRWFVTNPFEKICAACKSSLESSSPRIGRGENKWIFELPPLRFLLCKHWWFGEVEDNTSEVKIWVTCLILHLFTRLKILKEKVVSFCEVIFRSSLRVGSYIPWSSFTFMATTWIQVDTSIYIYIYTIYGYCRFVPLLIAQTSRKVFCCVLPKTSIHSWHKVLESWDIPSNGDSEGKGYKTDITPWSRM